MSDQPRRIDLNLTARHALWPGEQHICSRVYAPKLMDAWYITDIETGRMSELRVYTVGMLRRLEGMR